MGSVNQKLESPLVIINYESKYSEPWDVQEPMNKPATLVCILQQ